MIPTPTKIYPRGLRDDGGGLVATPNGEIAVFSSLNRAQHVGHRHSSAYEPSGFLLRVRRQPNRLLISVYSVSTSGDRALQPMH